MKKKPAKAVGRVILKDLLKPGEVFVRETYMRIHRQKHGLSTEEAAEKLNLELSAGTVTLYKKNGEVQLYQKQ